MLFIMKSRAFPFIVLFYYFTLSKCEKPTLSVRKVDSKTIDKKRRDTLEMCRLFNEENNQVTEIHEVENSLTEDNPQNHQRSKREVESDINRNPSLNKEDIVRIEGIVDKLYDDLSENATYRRREIEAKSNDTTGNRRFNFAPAMMVGPDSDWTTPDTHTTDPSKVPVPWIKKWKYGIIPYFIDPKTYDSYLASEIIKAFDYIEKATCIRLQRLREKPLDEKSLQQVEWLYITNPSGIKQCVHSNEKKPNKGVQMVVLGYTCLSLGEIAHEIMHVLGFSHEHTRIDRDTYITIRWDNIKDGYKKYFSLRPKDILSHLPYDYASVLHYPQRAFSRNGQITVLAPEGKKIGQREGFSEMDVEKIGNIFGTDCVDRNKDYLSKTCANVIKNKPPNVTVTPEEIAEYFQNKIWPYGIINYKIRDQMEFSAEERDNIKAVMNHIEKETCLIFKNINDDDEPEPLEDNGEQAYSVTINNEVTNYDNKKETGVTDEIRDNTGDVETTEPATAKVERRHAEHILVFTRSKQPGCKCPPSGRPDGNQVFEIYEDCFNSVNDLLHFFVHTLGLEHQHNMYDRDSYLEILWDQLTPEQTNELINVLPPAASVGYAYDYQSVMHYPWLQIQDGVTNIMYPIWNDGWVMGHWQGLSATDVRKLNRIYRDECGSRQPGNNK